MPQNSSLFLVVRLFALAIFVAIFSGSTVQGLSPDALSKSVGAGAGVPIARTQAERSGGVDPALWPMTTADWRTAPVDLSFMNATEVPAGKRGFVRAVGDKLQFADGAQVRFWGTNITAYALFTTPKDAVRAQAKRLSALGFNLVRLHHHDSFWVSPNIFGDTKATKNTRLLNAESLDRLDWWVKCLKDEGIYVWLDLHVQRALLKDDAIFGFDEIRKGNAQADLKGYNYVNPTIQSAMQRFNEAYVTHLNPYTHLANKDEPAIAAMLITNENDVTHHFGNALLPDKNVPDHNRLYTAAATAFAGAHDLPKDKVWRAWEHGPSKLFLNDLEHQFHMAMIGQLRALGVKVPIVTTNTWGGNPLSSLPALTTGDVIDVHSYGDAGQLEKNPLVADNMIDWIAAAQVVGKPLTVTEWNAVPFPSADRHTLPLYVAGNASLQGWDALMQYAYTQQPITGPGTASNWHSYNDPAMMATLPAAALMYRQGHVREAANTYVFAPSAAQLYGQAITPANSAALRTAAEIGRLLIALPPTKELPWLQGSAIPAGARVLHDPNESVLPAGAQEASSDTGEITRNWAKGTYTINTPRTQAAMGWIGGQTITLADLVVTVQNPSATVAVQSLDGTAIAQSKNLLISLGTRALPKQGNQAPFNVEPLDGEVSIKASKGLKLTKRNADQSLESIPVAYRGGRYLVPLWAARGSNWLFLKR